MGCSLCEKRKDEYENDIITGNREIVEIQNHTSNTYKILTPSIIIQHDQKNEVKLLFNHQEIQLISRKSKA